MKPFVPPVLAVLLAPSLALAEDVSPAPILQWFDTSYATMENRAADLFMAGYGAVWTPPPGRADSGDQSVGYDVYDRFDLGRAGRPTLYGTETGLKTVAKTFDRAGVNLQIDLIINHNGFSDQGDDHFIRSGGYPGFVIQNPDGGNDPYGVPNTDGDFNSSYDYGDLQGQLSGLLDIDHSQNWRFIRQPVAAGDPRNLPAGTDPQWGRLANVPDPDNARFYPDQQGSHIDVYDPVTGEADIRIYGFNSANPMAGDAVEENATGLLMRYAQWMVQEVGVDDFRIDAAKHVDGFTLTYMDRAVYRSNPRELLDGSTRHVFMYGEVFDSNRQYLLYGLDQQQGDPAAPRGSLAFEQWKDNFVRKDINDADPGTVGGNRDVLDFALVDQLNHNLSGDGTQNNWGGVVGGGLDAYDDGKLNGSAGVKFVSSHDKGAGAYLNNVAHAFTLLTPGNAVVYMNGKEFGDGRDFPKDGRGDALGGMYGESITKLVEIRSTHGRGDYRERWLEKENYAFERSKSMLVLLSNRLDSGYDTRRVDVDFAWGTTLVELTGNAAASGDIPELITVDNDTFEGQSKATVRFLRNGDGFRDRGYLAYGLATPRSEEGVELSNVSQVLAGGDPNAGGGSANYRNGTTRLADLHVITGDSFDLGLETQAVSLTGTRLENDQLVQRTIRDRDADGDNALFSIDGGLDAAGDPLDLNGNGNVDHRTPGSVVYGFEEFRPASGGVRNAGYDNVATGDGFYRQTIDATKLAEGTHFVTVRAFRRRNDGGPAVFSDFKKAIYVDRLKPVSGVDSFDPITAGVSGDRDVVLRSLDKTADNMHVFLDLAAGLDDDAVRGLVGGNSQAGRWDRDLWKYGFGDLAHGNHVITVVTYEVTGTWNVQRFAGFFTETGRGAGLGDLTFDRQYEGNDLDLMYDAVRSADLLFNPAGDFTGDGRVTLIDWEALGAELQAIHDAGTLRGDGWPLVSQGTLDYYHALSATVPEPAGVVAALGLAALLARRRAIDRG